MYGLWLDYRLLLSTYAILEEMKVSILYHPHSEYARPIEEYAHDFKRQRGHDVELVSLETRDGSSLASLYDIVRYPAILVTRESGELVFESEGPELPLMNELAAYIAT